MVNSKSILHQDILQVKVPKKIGTKIIDHFFLPVVILLLAVTIAAFYLIFVKAYRAARSGESAAKVAVLEFAIKDAQNHLEILRRHGSELEKVSESDIQRMAMVLPTGANELETLIQIEAFSKALNKEFNLDIQSFSVSVGAGVIQAGAAENSSLDADARLVDAETVADKITMSFKVSNYSSLKKVLSVIASNIRLLDINNLTYDPEKGDVTVNMTTRHLP